jgi:hypothetical protein
MLPLFLIYYRNKSVVKRITLHTKNCLDLEIIFLCVSLVTLKMLEIIVVNFNYVFILFDILVSC